MIYERWHQANIPVKKSNLDMPRDMFEMHEQYDFHNVELNKNQLKGRLDFIQEELDEAYESLDANDAPEFVDALIDMVVVAIGTLDLARVNSWKAWDEVLIANCSKLPGRNDKRHDMEGMDLVKPPGWKPPNHCDNVGILPEIMLRDESYYRSKRLSDHLESNKKAAQSKLNPQHRRRALAVLDECKQIMLEKADDYNSPVSPVRTIDYYKGAGLYDLFHMLTVKYLRIKSLVYKLYHGGTAKNESIVESLKDNIVFSAMTVEFVEGVMDGQEPEQRMFGEFTKNG